MRYGHSLHAYKNLIIMFGGVEIINMQKIECEYKSDLLIYDTLKNQWKSKSLHFQLHSDLAVLQRVMRHSLSEEGQQRRQQV